MITPENCLKLFGKPDIDFERKWMVMWDVPQSINDAIPALPNRIYCNKLMVPNLEKAFRELIAQDVHHELKTWDGCFNVRLQRGSKTKLSIHSWAIAIDVNASWNGLGKIPTLSDEFVACFEKFNFDWGGRFRMPRTDGMHFQLDNI